MHKASLIISVYNKVKELEFIFHALSLQSEKDFEVIIAEDGKNAEMQMLVAEWKLKNLFTVIHITQEDKGFRKNKILNEAIRNSSTDYLIFIDGDCIPHSDFIRAHYENKQENSVLCGRRVTLTKKMSGNINKKIILNLNYQNVRFSDIMFSSLNKGRINLSLEEGFIIKNKALRKVLTNPDEHILGCNFSIEKVLLEKINGFDENYEGPGIGEDSDIEFRLRLTGAKFKSVRYLAVQYHLYHVETIEDPGNLEYFNKMKENREYFCKNGLLK